MEKREYLNKLRRYLSDPFGKIWDDDHLNDILEESLRRYCYDSGIFSGRLDFYPDESGVYHYPEDFLRFKVGFNCNGREIVPVTGRELFIRSGWSNKVGDPEYIYDDISDTGEFCLYPVPDGRQNHEDLKIEPFQGEVENGEFGVFQDGYGTTLEMNSFDFAGEIYYVKQGDFSDVKDHNGVLYYALYLSYNSDMDFGNADMARIWLQRYRSRLGAFTKIDHINKGKLRKGSYY